MKSVSRGQKVSVIRVFETRRGREVRTMPHTGEVLDHLDPRAWREQKNRDKVFPWTEAYGSDISHGRTVPTDVSRIRFELNLLILKGEMDLTRRVPVRWNFDGYFKIYWEEVRLLIRPIETKTNRRREP